MKIFFVSTLLSILFVYGLAQYEHNYGHGHGGGHGIYGYPVGRKWGYSTYIKHPPPKHHGHGGQGYGGHGHRNQGYGFGGPGGFGHGFWPNFGSGFGNTESHGYGGGYPAQSHTYRRQYTPFSGYDFGRKRREDGFGHNSGYNHNSIGQHKNHNYGNNGDNYGAHSKTYNTEQQIKPRHESSDFGGFESMFGSDFPNYLVDLNLPDNFQQLIY